MFGIDKHALAYSYLNSDTHSYTDKYRDEYAYAHGNGDNYADEYSNCNYDGKPACDYRDRHLW
jgi:hypothetical protein